jgi:hypothetical protein
MANLLIQMIFCEGYFYGVIFSRWMAPNEDILDVSKGQDDGNNVGVLNLIKIFWWSH